MNRSLNFLIILLCLLFNTAEASVNRHIKVGVFVDPPFAMFNVNKFTGISVDIWKQVAKDEKIDYQFVKASESIDNAFKELDALKYDVLIGGFPITPKLSLQYDFSRPYFISHLSYISYNEDRQFFAIFKHIMLEKWMNYLYLAIGILFIFSIIHVVVETKKDRLKMSMSNSTLKVFYNYLILFIASCALNENDAKVTKVITRILHLIALSFSIIFISAFLSAMGTALTITTSNLTYSNRPNYQKLYNRNIIVLRGSYADTILKKLNITKKLVVVKNNKEAMKLLKEDHSALFVGRYTEIKNFVINNKQINSQPYLIDDFGATEYGFAFRVNDTLQYIVSHGILNMRETQEIMPICDKYVESTESQGCIG